MKKKYNIVSFLLAVSVLVFPVHGAVEILPLFPEEGESVEATDLLLVATVLDDEEQGGSVEVLLDGKQVIVEKTDATIQWKPPASMMEGKSMEGRHTFEIIVRGKDGTVSASEKISFVVTVPEKEEAAAKSVSHDGRVYAEVRQYKVGDQGNQIEYYTGGLYNGSSGKLRYGAEVLQTNLEDEQSQARNIYRINVGYGRLLSLNLGDARPRWDELVLTGQRMRGVEMNTKVFLPSGLNIFNLDVAYGLSRRAVSPYQVADSASAPWVPGTYSQSILAVRPSFGSGRVFKWGFTFLRGRDDTASITRLDTTQTSTGSSAPKDNLVLGTDLLLRLFRKRFELFGNAALSLLTNNTLGGPVKMEEIDSTVATVISDPESFSNTFVFNTSTTPISDTLRGVLNSAMFSAGFRIITPARAVRNRFELKYERKGANYYSMGNPLLGSARHGVLFSDQLSFLQNRMQLNGNFGIYTNNVDGLEEYPVLTQTMGVRAYLNYAKNIPSLSVGYGRNSSANESNVYSFDNGLNTVNGNVSYNYRLGSYIGTVQLFSNWSDVSNSWNTSSYNPDSSTVMTDTSIAFNMSTVGANLSTELPNLPLTLYFGGSSSSGSKQFVGANAGHVGAKCQILPEKLSVNARVKIRMIKLANSTETEDQTVGGYGITFTPAAAHRATFYGDVTRQKENVDIMNQVRYEWRF